MAADRHGGPVTQARRRRTDSESDAAGAGGALLTAASKAGTAQGGSRL